jgi:hypothetical protein
VQESIFWKGRVPRADEHDVYPVVNVKGELKSVFRVIRGG